MSDALAVKLPAENDVLVAALAQAAAALQAARGGGGRPGAGASADREMIKDCAREVLTETFRKFDVDLDETDSVREFRADLTHARKSRRSWEKAGATAIGAIATAIVSGIIALLMRYVSTGGGK